METCDVLIIGGGFAGINSAIELAKHGKQVILVDKREFFEYTPGILRYLVSSDDLDSISTHYTQIANANGFRFLQGTVTLLKINTAVLVDVVIKFQYAIVACGCAYPSPIRPKIETMEERVLELSECRKEFKNVSKIAIIGGGIVGVELAGEIVEAFPEKLVVLYTRGSELLQTMPKLARRAAQIWLEQHGVQFFFGHSMENAKEFDLVFK